MSLTNDLRLLRKAADQGNIDAQITLGREYHSGKLLSAIDIIKNLKYLTFNHREELTMGKNIQHNYSSKAYKYYRMAADQGHPFAEQRLAVLYVDGDGVPKDDNKAIEWLEKSAEQGNNEAQVWLGDIYKEGKKISKNYDKASKWYKEAADRGNKYAISNLAELYENGQGVPKDYNKAIEWYYKAQDNINNSGNMNAKALYALGQLYEKGKGTPQDYKQAIRYYDLAADVLEYKPAQQRLAYIYARGLGVQKDTQKAHYWDQKSREPIK